MRFHLPHEDDFDRVPSSSWGAYPFCRLFPIFLRIFPHCGNRSPRFLYEHAPTSRPAYWLFPTFLMKGGAIFVEWPILRETVVSWCLFSIIMIAPTWFEYCQSTLLIDKKQGLEHPMHLMHQKEGMHPSMLTHKFICAIIWWMILGIQYKISQQFQS
jgi:hypothetical protein